MAWVGKRPARRLGGMADVLTMASDLGFHLPVSPGSSLIIVIIIILTHGLLPHSSSPFFLSQLQWRLLSLAASHASINLSASSFQALKILRSFLTTA
jgi:hypothetical protein